MQTTHTTYSCDLQGCAAIVDGAGDYPSLPNAWVTISCYDSTETWVERQRVDRMFCGWAHAAEWTAMHAERVAERPRA